jgi:hypothetical protein
LGGGKCSPRAKESGEIECEENVSVMKIDGGVGSGGTPTTLELAPGRLGVVNLLQDKLGEPLVNQKRKEKGRRGLSFTGGGDDTAAADEQRRRQW